jgi:hypothetical protein
MIKAEKLQAIVDSNDQDPRVLCELVGGDPRNFYCGANFNDTDLRGVDLRGYNLTAATFENTWLDRNTKVDDAYINAVGLRRTAMIIPDFRVSSNKPLSEKIPATEEKHYLGDILDEGIRILESQKGNLMDFFGHIESANQGNVERAKRESRRLADLIVGFNPKFLGSEPNIVSGKTNSLRSMLVDNVEESHQQPSVNLFELEAIAPRSSLARKMGLARWGAIVEQLRTRLPTGEKKLEITIFLSTHKKIVALSSIRKMHTEMFAAELLLNFVSFPPEREEASVGWMILPKQLV